MRRVICLFCLPILIFAQLYAASFTVQGAETATTAVEKTTAEVTAETAAGEEAPEESVVKDEIYYDVSGETKERIYNRYAETFENGDISLVMAGENLEYIPFLTQFHFHSLDITIQYETEYDLSHMATVDWILFPEETEHVYITCGDEMMLKSSDALGRLIISLWVCCPDATLNDKPVTGFAQQVYAVDSYNLADMYETDAKLHYVYELAEAGELEEISSDPVFCGKLIFDVFDDSELTSQECIIAGEAFFDVPSSWLAKSFDNADTAIYIYPATSVIGRYSNGGEAVSTFTRVMVVDLHTMRKYKEYTAVRNDPPENLTITYENGEYSTEGAAGAYDPDVAISDIVNSGTYLSNVPDSIPKETDLSGILPWAGIQVEENAMVKEQTTTQQETASAEGQTTEQVAAGQKTTTNLSPVVTERGSVQEPEATTGPEVTTEPELAIGQETVTETSSSTEPEGQVGIENAVVPGSATEPENTKEEGLAVGKEEPTSKEPETVAEVYIDKNVYNWLTEDLLELIFDELGDDLYRTTYETLKSSKDLQKGSKGDLVLSLQKTLNAFGRNISEDSSFGNGTLNALNTVQKAYNLSAETKVNAKTYALLMPALLMYTNEDAASRLMEGGMSYENGNEFVYMQACTYLLNEHYYRARELFESSGYGNFDSRALSCVLDMPETGVLVGNTGAAGSNATLTIKVNNPDDSAVTCAKVFSATDELVACLIVRGSDSAKAVLPAGDYRIISGTGYRWYGINDMFGDEGIYETLLFDGGSETMELRSGYDYTITYNVQEHNDAAIHVGSETLDWEELGE